MNLKIQEFIFEHEDWLQRLQEYPYNIKINEDEDYVLLKYDMINSDFDFDIVREYQGLI